MRPAGQDHAYGYEIKILWSSSGYWMSKYLLYDAPFWAVLGCFPCKILLATDAVPYTCTGRVLYIAKRLADVSAFPRQVLVGSE